CGGDGDRLGLDQFELIVPRVNFHSAAERERRDLVDLLGIELRRGGHQRRHPGGVAIEQAVAQVRPNQVLQLRRPGLDRFEEQAGVAQLVFVGRTVEQFHGFLVGGFFFAAIASEVHALEGALIGKEHAVVESEFGIEVMAEDYVREFVGKNHGQRRFVGQHVDHASAHDDGMTNGEGLERRGHQYAAAYVGLNIEVIGDYHNVEDGL